MIRVQFDGGAYGVRAHDGGVKVVRLSGPERPWVAEQLAKAESWPILPGVIPVDVPRLVWQVEQVAKILDATSVTDDGKDWSPIPEGATP